jgi:hypothetical protein
MPAPYLNHSACEKLKTVVDGVMATQFDAQDDLRITYNTNQINPDTCRAILNGNYYKLHYPNVVCIVENLAVTRMIHIYTDLSSKIYNSQI